MALSIVHLEDEPWDSGIASYAVTLGFEQACRGHRVAVWGVTGSPVLKDAGDRGLPTHGWSEGPAGWAEIPALRRAMKEFKPDLLNAHTGSAHAMALILAPRGVPVVRTRADARPAKSHALARWAAGRTAGFIAANSAIKTELSDAFPRSHIHLVPQGVEGLDEMTDPPGAPIVGILGRLDAVKGHQVLLDAAQILAPQIPGLRVVCAGQGKLLERLRWQLKPSGLERTVALLGRVPDRWAFTYACRVGVVPSIGSEAVSRVTLEWMASGRPVVASRVGGIPDLVEHGVTGLLVEPGNAQELAAALKTLLDDPGRAHAMGVAARDRWASSFTPATFYNYTQSAYESILAAAAR